MLEKTYQPETIESRWYSHWERHGCFQPSGEGEPYCILLPPPNVTGTLHMGHAFQHTLMDVLVRYQRLRGRDVLWQVGSDHAGIATEMVVSRNLAIEGKGETRDSLGREGFIEKVWEWKARSGDTIERQMRRLGASGDWSRSVFTMDEMPARAVTEAFVRLHEKGLIYRGQRLVNWDPVLKTAISDLEVENREVPGHMWHFKYPLAGGETYEYIERDGEGNVTLREVRDYISIATTRPETMLGDGAVAVHPSDTRYAPIVGKLCEIPVGPKEHRRLIPIITDDYPDPGFGSGAVKITGAHDFNDYAVASRNGIPLYALMDDGARMRSDGLPYEDAARIAGQIACGEREPGDVAAINLVPEELRGLDRYAARERVVEAITAEGLAVTDAEGNPVIDNKPIMQPFGDRSGTVIEPYLTDQWFVKMDGLARRGMALVESGEVKFVPPNWINTYRHWMENIQDWCISRQLWWGHRIPAWYDEAGNCFVGRDETEVRARYGLGDDLELSQDSDVLETWFSSALWPFSTQGWPEEAAMAERGFDRYLPTSVLVTGFDIIFFWVARMIMMSDHFTGEVPFRDVYITGLIRDAHGQKMSKSKGNVLDPLDLIDGISADDLVAKRTTGLMKPTDAPKIEKATRNEFPDGMPAFGADALRFTLTALAGPGRDIKFDLGRAEGYRNFINKLWNASRFVLMQIGDSAGTEALAAPAPEHLDMPSRWIRSRLGALIEQVDRHLAAYRFDLATSALYDFVWGEFCDWYLELAKPCLADDADPDTRHATRHTLAAVLETVLRLLHPVIPFVTEELWQQIKTPAGATGESIMRARWPEAGGRDDPAEEQIAWLQNVIGAVRSARTELNLAPGKPLPLLVQHADKQDRARFESLQTWISRLARVESIELVDDGHDPGPSVAALAGNLRLLIPIAGLVDIGEELVRLRKQRDKAAAGLKQTEAKLANERFVANAPDAVVAKEKTRLAEHQTALARLDEQINRLEAVTGGR